MHIEYDFQTSGMGPKWVMSVYQQPGQPKPPEWTVSLQNAGNSHMTQLEARALAMGILAALDALPK